MGRRAEGTPSVTEQESLGRAWLLGSFGFLGRDGSIQPMNAGCFMTVGPSFAVAAGLGEWPVTHPGRCHPEKEIVE
jgi:hypothetical protein